MPKSATRIALALVALIAAGPLCAADPSVPAANAAAVDRAAERGRMIFAYDRAAWIATDDMLAKLADARQKIGGWIVEGPAETPRVIFYDRSAPPRAAYLVTVSKGRPLGGHAASPAEQPLQSDQLARIAALRTARAAFMASGSPACGSRPYNTVVLPPKAAGGPFLVYFLTPQAALDSFPMGGHYLVEVDGKGVAGPVRAFAKTCLNMQAKGAGGKVEAMVVTHLLDPAPTEIHVFTMYAAGVPVIVGTTQNNLTWLINEGPAGTQIRVVTARAK